MCKGLQSIYRVTAAPWLHWCEGSHSTDSLSVVDSLCVLSRLHTARFIGGTSWVGIPPTATTLQWKSGGVSKAIRCWWGDSEKWLVLNEKYGYLSERCNFIFFVWLEPVHLLIGTGTIEKEIKPQRCVKKTEKRPCFPHGWFVSPFSAAMTGSSSSSPVGSGQPASKAAHCCHLQFITLLSFPIFFPHTEPKQVCP